MAKTNAALKRTVRIGLLTAVSIVLMYIIRIPFPLLPILEYDPADIPVLIGGMMYGPVWGVVLTVIVSLVQGLTVSVQGGPYGILMHIIATSTLVLTASLIYTRCRTKKNAVIGLICGTLAMTAIMIPANLVVTPLYYGMPVSAVIGLIPAILLFNLLKAGINSIVTFFLYRRISYLLDPQHSYSEK